MPPVTDQEPNRLVRAVGRRLVELLAALAFALAGWAWWPPLAWAALPCLAWIVIDPVQQRLRPLVRRWSAQRRTRSKRITPRPANAGDEPARDQVRSA